MLSQGQIGTAVAASLGETGSGDPKPQGRPPHRLAQSSSKASAQVVVFSFFTSILHFLAEDFTC
jgi:hypothetical protein